MTCFLESFGSRLSGFRDPRSIMVASQLSRDQWLFFFFLSTSVRFFQAELLLIHACVGKHAFHKTRYLGSSQGHPITKPSVSGSVALQQWKPRITYAFSWAFITTKSSKHTYLREQRNDRQSSHRPGSTLLNKFQNFLLKGLLGKRDILQTFESTVELI